MRKIITSLGILTVLLITTLSCTNSITEIGLPDTVSINFIAPTNGANIVLNPNNPNLPATTLKWSAANFGYVAEVVYTLQIVKSNENFTANPPATISIGNYSESVAANREFDVKNTILNLVLNSYELVAGQNIYDTPVTYKMRIMAQPAAQVSSSTVQSTAYSQEVTFTATTYDPIAETPKIFTIGNFGTASTYTDWDVNLTGTSNSPLLYSPAKDEKYTGFVYMNNTVPHFQFANPIDTNLNIYGLGAVAGKLAKSVSVDHANDIIIPATLPSTSGIGTYYITANLNSADAANSYTVLKRRFAIIGSATKINATTYNLFELTYDTNPASPYYRMYTNTNVTLNPGSIKVKMNDGSAYSFSSSPDYFGYDNSAIMENSTSAATQVKNKTKIGGGAFSITPGNYTAVLDVRNSAIYNIRLVQN